MPFTAIAKLCADPGNGSFQEATAAEDRASGTPAARKRLVRRGDPVPPSSQYSGAREKGVLQSRGRVLHVPPLLPYAVVWDDLTRKTNFVGPFSSQVTHIQCTILLNDSYTPQEIFQ